MPPIQTSSWGWTVGLLFSAAFLSAIYLVFPGPVERLEATLFRTHYTVPPDRQLAIIAIDEESIKTLGPWPWSRDVLANVIDRLALAGARTIATTIIFSEPQPGVSPQRLRELLDRFSYANESSPAGSTAGLSEIPSDQLALDRELGSSDLDQRLADSMAAAGNVVLPFAMRVGGGETIPPDELPDSLDAQTLLADTEIGQSPKSECSELAMPISQLAISARSLGFELTDSATLVRTPLVVSCAGRWLPSLPLAVAAYSTGLEPGDLRFGPTGSFGDIVLRTHDDLTVLPAAINDDDFESLSVTSFWTVLSGSVTPDLFQDRIVLIGPLGTARVGGVELTDREPLIELAAKISSLLAGHTALRPGWAIIAETALWVLLVVYASFLLPRLSAATALLVGGIWLLTILGTQRLLLEHTHQWLYVVGPAIFVVLTHLLVWPVIGRRVVVPQPVRRSRGFQMVSDRPQTHPQRSAQSRPPANQRRPDPGHTGSLPTSGDDEGEIWDLGRYRILRVIGKGAMGVVYLARDPQIDRMVAVKAIPLAEEFEEDDLPGARRRFFREAQTAGRLNHPNIVTIYDVGEADGLAFIAMEYLRGQHLSDFTARDRLLPATRVLELGASAAEALAYAHDQNVVHRDVKPANLMYDPANDELKITDFGIARMTDASATRTGIVLGTPSFMSPEQLEGKNVTGPSDLFSLGVSLYQLLSGQLPFRADSMTGLMSKIATEPHRPVRELRPDLPECVDDILSRALRKDPGRRYQSGAELAGRLRSCRAEMMKKMT